MSFALLDQEELDFGLGKSKPLGLSSILLVYHVVVSCLLKQFSFQIILRLFPVQQMVTLLSGISLLLWTISLNQKKEEISRL